MTDRARTTLTTAAVLTAALALAGCSGATHTDATRPAAATTSVPSVSPTAIPASPAVTESLPTPVVYSTFSPAPFASTGTTVTTQPTPVVPPAGPVEFAGPVAARFGAVQSAAAYVVATRLELATTFDPTLLAEATPTLAQVEPVAGPYLDATGKAALAASTAHGDAGDNLYALFTYGVGDGQGYSFRGARVDDTVAGPPTDAEIHHTAHGDELYLRFTVTGRLLLTHAGSQVTVPVSKDCVLNLTPGVGQDGWLVDQWFGETDLGNPAAA